jgi:hypothetical protein
VVLLRESLCLPKGGSVMTNRHVSVAPPLFVERESVTSEELVELGVDLERDYPGASVEDFKRYPVLTEGGWFMVVRHQRTLQTIDSRPWHLLGPVKLTSHRLSNFHSALRRPSDGPLTNRTKESNER